MKRVILVVMDSLGVGEEPDAEKYGDLGADTFLHAAGGVEGFAIPNLQSLGMGNIQGAAKGKYRVSEEDLQGSFGRMREVSAGKDTITGHWEIAGIETKTPFKTYPQGFPKAFIEKFEEAIGIGCIGNYPASGTEIIKVLGPEHERTGKPIVYTSQDSVFQIAANTAVIPLERLYAICETARSLLQGDWACGRVIARPYVLNEDGSRTRTADRRDYAVAPPEDTILDKIEKAGKRVYAVGKIHDIFDGKGVTDSVHTTSNDNGITETIRAMKENKGDFIFTNLVDFDSLYGHRRDAAGYAKAIMELDRRIPELQDALQPEDLLIFTADHGNDPVHFGWDHTREYVPVLISGDPVKVGVNLGTRGTFADLGATVTEYLGAESTSLGTSFLSKILK